MHSSASSFPISGVSRQALLTHGASAHLQPRLHAETSPHATMSQKCPEQQHPCPDGDTSGQGKLQCLQGNSVPCGDHSSAAYALLFDPRQALHTRSPKPSCMSETIAEGEEREERARCHSNLRSLIAKARALQVSALQLSVISIDRMVLRMSLQIAVA